MLMPCYYLKMRQTRNLGIAIGPILFVVALLAVLASAIAAGSGSFNNDTTQQSARLHASKIIENMKLVRDAVQKVSANGCSFVQVSFENTIASGYTNANSPLATRPQCHIFHPLGGGINVPIPARDALVETLSGNQCCGGQYAYWAVRHSGVDGAAGTPVGSGAWCGGTDPCGAELMVSVPYLRRDVCVEINNQLNVRNPSGNPPVQIHNASINSWQGNNVNGTWFAANYIETTPVFAGCVERLGFYTSFMVTLYN